jgi:putative membrane protein
MHPFSRSVLTALLATVIAQASIAQTATTPQSATTGQGDKAAQSDKMVDKTFVHEASAAGLSEVADAQKAVQMAKRDDVRKAAQQLLTDHTAANAKLKSLAESKRLPLATGAAPSNVPASTSGDFDAKYIAAQVKAHENAIALFKAEARDGRDTELREFASSTLPILEHHLSMMQSLH